MIITEAAENVGNWFVYEKFTDPDDNIYRLKKEPLTIYMKILGVEVQVKLVENYMALANLRVVQLWYSQSDGILQFKTTNTVHEWTDDPELHVIRREIQTLKDTELIAMLELSMFDKGNEK